MRILSTTYAAFAALTLASLTACSDDEAELDYDQQLSTLTDDDVDGVCALLSDDFAIIDDEEAEKANCYIAGLVVEQREEGTCAETVRDCLDQDVADEAGDVIDEVSGEEGEDADVSQGNIREVVVEAPNCDDDDFSATFRQATASCTEATVGELQACFQEFVGAFEGYAQSASCNSDLEAVEAELTPTSCATLVEGCPAVSDIIYQIEVEED